MADQPPRKQLKVLTRSKEKIGSLLQRRRREKDKATHQNETSDFEGNEPILLKIADPARIQSSRATPCKEDSINAPTTKAKPQASASRSSGSTRDPGPDREEARAHDDVAKAQRRQGVIGAPGTLQAFQTQVAVSRNRTVAVQPSAEIQPASFSFNNVRRDSGTANASSKPGRTTQDCKLLAVKGPLDQLKLDHHQSATAPRLDQAQPINRIFDYIRPQITRPEPGPEIYRAQYHKPELPQPVFERTMPDIIEARSFTLDVMGDNAPPRLTEYGDVTALDTRKQERVPTGARRQTEETGGGSHHSPQTNTKVADRRGLPHHAAAAARKSSLNAIFAQHGRQELKRKRPSDPRVLPPQDHIYKHSGKADFNIFTNGFLFYPELCLLLSSQLPVKTLINLYSISKDFHIIVNQRITTVILNQLTLKAPNAARCYPWRCYNHLCQPDPSFRSGTIPLAEHLNSTSTTHSGGATINIRPPPTPPNHTTIPPSTRPPQPALLHRRVPTFRYALFAITREKTIHALYHTFAARGVPLPGSPTDTHTNSFCVTLHKLSFLLDIPDNARRITYMHTPSLISNADLANLLVFVVKVDMLCNDPLAAEKRDNVRKMLFGSDLGTMVRVVRREEWRDHRSVMRAWARYALDAVNVERTQQRRAGGFVPLRLSEEELRRSGSVFGVPRDEVGLMKREFWGRAEFDEKTGKRVGAVTGAGRNRVIGRMPMNLIRPDQLALREVQKRGMTFSRGFLQGLLHGYVDPETMEACKPRDLNGGRSVVLEREGEYEVDDAVAGMQALSVEEGGDPLLDLGDTWKGSPWTVVHRGVGTEEVGRRAKEDERIEGHKAAWRAEVEEERRRQAFAEFRFVN